MRSFIKILTKNKEAKRLLLFHLLFFGGMNISKVVHPLWFDQNNSLIYFGLSYSAMAFVGVFSFIQGYFSIRIGIRKTVIFGLVLYSIGMFLRIFPSPTVAIISGIVAGIGASTSIVCIRPWLMYFSDKNQHSQVMALHNFGTNLGTALGGVLASILIAFLSVYYMGYKEILIISAFFPIIAIFSIPSKNIDLKIKESENKNGENKGFFKTFKVNKLLVLGVLFFGILTGFTLSILSPFLPVILKDIGFSVSAIGIITASMLVIRIILDPLVSSVVSKNNKQLIFFISEVIFAITTFSLLSNANILILLVILYIRTISLGISMFTEGVIQMEIYPKYISGMLFGLSQSAFWIGDSVGGSVGALLYQTGGVQTILIISTILIIINAFCFPIFTLIIKRKNKQEVNQNGEDLQTIG